MNKKKYILSIVSFVLFKLSYSQEIDSQKKEGVVTINSDPKIDQLLLAKYSNNYESNYKIQLYYGSLTKAHNILNEFTEYHPNISGKILFETPNYKVWVGDFRTRLDADKALMDIRKKFPNAFIFKPKTKD